MTRIGLALLCGGVLLAACGDDGDESSAVDASTSDARAADANPNAPDANPNAPDAGPDATPTGPVQPISCVGAVVGLTVTTTNNENQFKFDGDTEIAPNTIVEFEMSSNHNAISGTPAGTSDGKFTAPAGMTTCFRFVDVGDYPFYCGPHRFTGEITVKQP